MRVNVYLWDRYGWIIVFQIHEMINWVVWHFVVDNLILILARFLQLVLRTLLMVDKVLREPIKYNRSMRRS